LNGIKFRRQVPVGPYIVDFLCGSPHAESHRDNVRDVYLARQGWKVLRFWNNEVLRKREGVLETIVAHAAKPSSGPSRHLPPEGEGSAHLLPPGEDGRGRRPDEGVV